MRDTPNDTALPFSVRGSWDNPSLMPDLLRRSGLNSETRLALLLKR